MIGDIILSLKEWVHQNLFCIHTYIYKGKLDHLYEECNKCGKLK